MSFGPGFLSRLRTAVQRIRADAYEDQQDRRPGGPADPAFHDELPQCPVEGCENGTDRFRDTTDEDGVSMDALPCESCHAACEICGEPDVLKVDRGACQKCVDESCEACFLNPDPSYDCKVCQGTGVKPTVAAAVRSGGKDVLRRLAKPTLKFPASEGMSDAPVSTDLLPPGKLDAAKTGTGFGMLKMKNLLLFPNYVSAKPAIIERPTTETVKKPGRFMDQTMRLDEKSVGTVTFDTSKGSTAVS